MGVVIAVGAALLLFACVAVTRSSAAKNTITSLTRETPVWFWCGGEKYVVLQAEEYAKLLAREDRLTAYEDSFGPLPEEVEL